MTGKVHKLFSHKYILSGVLGLFGLVLMLPLTVTLLTRSTHIAQHAAGTTNVSLLDDAFSPSSITIQAGDTVVWTNTSTSIPHTVTSTTGLFDSGNLNPGGTFSYQFTTPGTYSYKCNYHPDMVASVIVLAAVDTPTDTPAPTIAPTNTLVPPLPTATTIPQPTTAPVIQTTSISPTITPMPTSNIAVIVTLTPTPTAGLSATPTLTTVNSPTVAPTEFIPTLPVSPTPSILSPTPPFLIASLQQKNIQEILAALGGILVLLGLVVAFFHLIHKPKQVVTSSNSLDNPVNIP